MYELLQLGPSAYVPALLASIVLTLLVYSAFPLAFAGARKKIISKRKYYVICFGVNFLVMMLLALLNGEASSGSPYLLWTWVFADVGIRKLKGRAVLKGFQPCDPPPPEELNGAGPEEEPENRRGEEMPEEESGFHARVCRGCGFELIEDSAFCSHCGTPVMEEGWPEVAAPFCEAAEREVWAEAAPEPLPEGEGGAKEPPGPQMDADGCGKGDAAVIPPPDGAGVGPDEDGHRLDVTPDDGPVEEGAYYGRRQLHAKTWVPLVVLSLLLVLSVGFNVTQYLRDRQAAGSTEVQAARILELEEALASQKDSASFQESIIASHKRTISELRGKASYFDIICMEFRYGKVGYASESFRASESVILVDKDEKGRKFELTANWDEGGTVFAECSNYAAAISFDEDTWETSVQITIEPKYEGVTVATFRNDMNSETFSVLIIVTD